MMMNNDLSAGDRWACTVAEEIRRFKSLWPRPWRVFRYTPMPPEVRAEVAKWLGIRPLAQSKRDEVVDMVAKKMAGLAGSAFFLSAKIHRNFRYFHSIREAPSCCATAPSRSPRPVAPPPPWRPRPSQPSLCTPPTRTWLPRRSGSRSSGRTPRSCGVAPTATPSRGPKPPAPQGLQGPLLCRLLPLPPSVSPLSSLASATGPPAAPLPSSRAIGRRPRFHPTGIACSPLVGVSLVSMVSTI
ncbi:hypothetical protein GQ55_9G041000 [Panicum hallii var. hallii]|uniref:Uncharacterized protein n=1 Tax=Panicum hallii var. hallii TaxID=1504633 RepID=A0A2T7BZJ0_9POAL|nr:hypothetical protein GQ55_9G041000 [Panicum hallii var. hallii]